MAKMVIESGGRVPLVLELYHQIQLFFCLSMQPKLYQANNINQAV